MSGKVEANDFRMYFLLLVLLEYIYFFILGVLSWQDLLQRGKAWPYLKNKLAERLQQVSINQCCRLGKKHALKKFDYFAQNTSCF